MLYFLGLFSAGGMGLWHGVEHWERNKITTKSDTELFTQSWPQVGIGSYFDKIRICYDIVHCRSSRITPSSNTNGPTLSHGSGWDWP